MKIKIQSSELAQYQREADQMMNWIDVQYTNLLDPIFKKTNGFKILYKRFTSLFSWPPSLRFYHFGEELTNDREILRKAKIYRQAWHKYWSIKHQFNQVSGDEESEIWLDSYETEVIMSLRKCMGLVKEFK